MLGNMLNQDIDDDFCALFLQQDDSKNVDVVFTYPDLSGPDTQAEPMEEKLYTNLHTVKSVTDVDKSSLPTVLDDDFDFQDSMDSMSTSVSSASPASSDCFVLPTEDVCPRPRGPPRQDVRASLRSKIQTRRISEGKGHLILERSPERKYNMTPDEERKSDQRRLRNRNSANKSRLKRKQEEKYLTGMVTELETKHSKLAMEIDALKRYKLTLVGLYKRHLSRCQANSKERKIEKLKEYLKSPVS